MQNCLLFFISSSTPYVTGAVHKWIYSPCQQEIKSEPNQLTHIKEVLAVNNWASNNWLNYTCLLIMKVIYIESDKYAK